VRTSATWPRFPRQAAIASACAALHARYLGWASGTPNHPGVLGDTAEKLVHQAISRANGYYQLSPKTGQTSLLRGVSVPGGVLDNAAILTVIDPQANTPTGTFDVVVEVKNLRLWLYPGDAELHQLLWKAAALQQALPNAAILPVLVCRQTAYLTNKLIYELGVYVIRTKNQLAPPNLDDTKLGEVVTELGYRIDNSPEPDPAMIRHFNTLIPADARELSERWRTGGAAFLPLYEQLRRDDLDRPTRDALRAQLLSDTGLTDYGNADPPEGFGTVQSYGDDDPPW
jgi:hypothetical protein